MKSLEEGKYLSFPYHVDLPEARKHERLEQLAANAARTDHQHPACAEALDKRRA